MKKLILVLCVIFSVSAGTAWAQAFPPNEAGVTMGHLHLNSRDVAANKKIFLSMGGNEVKSGNFETVRFPGVLVILQQATGTPPPKGGTAGSIINHGGFAVKKVHATG